MSVGKKVLVLGGSLGVGKRLAHLLVQQRHDVTLLNRGNYDDQLGDSVCRIQCDRNNTTALAQAIDGARWDVIYDQVCSGLGHAEQVCKVFANKTDRFVFCSSQAVYGLGQELPESDFDPISFQSVGYLSNFAAGKKQAEAYLFRHAPWPVVAVRFPTLFSADEPRLSFHLARMCAGLEIHFPKLDCELSLIDRDSAADCLAFLLDAGHNGPINCSALAPIRLSRFKELLEQTMGLPMRLTALPSAQNSSPYALPESWTLSCEKLRGLGYGLSSIEDQLIEAIKQTDKRSAAFNLLDYRPEPITRCLFSVGLRGQKVLITGASNGFGRALAFNLATAGAELIVHGNSQKHIDDTVSQIVAAGFCADGIQADLRDLDQCDRLIEFACQSKPVDVLINNAAITQPQGGKAFWRTDPKAWQDVLTVNLSAPLVLTSRFLRLLEQGLVPQLRVIQILDELLFLPDILDVFYRVSKNALQGMTQSMASYVRDSRFSIVAIERGAAQTNISQEILGSQAYGALAQPDTLSPLFHHVLAAPMAQVHGRVFSSADYNLDPDAALRMNSSWVQTAPYRLDTRYNTEGVEIDRQTDQWRPYDRGENPMGPSPKALAALQQISTIQLARYSPRGDYLTLKRRLGATLNLPSDCITPGVGSNELIERLLRCFASVGDSVVSNLPCYFMFERICRALKLMNRRVPLREFAGNLTHDLDSIANSVTPSTKLIYLISPHNPIGISISEADFRAFLEKIPTHIPVVVDEAYLEYRSRPGQLNTSELMQSVDHCLIGLRTLSKAYGLAGIRVGYAYSRPDTILLLERLEPLNGISTLSESVALAAIEDQAHLAETRRRLREDRERIEARFRQAGIEFQSSDTVNFPVKVCFNVDELVARLEQHKILISPQVYMGYLNIPVGIPEVSDIASAAVIELSRASVQQ